MVEKQKELISRQTMLTVTVVALEGPEDRGHSQDVSASRWQRRAREAAGQADEAQVATRRLHVAVWY